MNKKKSKPSGPAIFMYCVITLTAVIAVVSFVLYYCEFAHSDVILWIGVTCFTIMYHLWMRLIFGNISKLLKVNYNMWWFKEKSFEKNIYKFFKVKSWKGKALTYNPELYDLKSNTLNEIANTMCKSEIDHLINVLISLSTLLFSLIWGQFFIFFVTSILAIAFDMQFVLIQRYNRPRVLRIIKRQEKVLEKK